MRQGKERQSRRTDGQIDKVLEEHRRQLRRRSSTCSIKYYRRNETSRFGRLAATRCRVHSRAKSFPGTTVHGPKYSKIPMKQLSICGLESLPISIQRDRSYDPIVIFDDIALAHGYASVLAVPHQLQLPSIHPCDSRTLRLGVCRWHEQHAIRAAPSPKPFRNRPTFGSGAEIKSRGTCRRKAQASEDDHTPKLNSPT